MTDLVPEEELVRQLRLGQIIVAMLTAGCVVFVGVMLVLRGGQGPDEGQFPLMTMEACLFAVAVIVARLVIPYRMVVSGRRRLARELAATAPAGFAPLPENAVAEQVRKLLPLHQVKLLTGTALLEGAVLFGGLAYYHEGVTFALIQAGLLALVIALHFPSRNQLEQWLEKQWQLLDEHIKSRLGAAAS